MRFLSLFLFLFVHVFAFGQSTAEVTQQKAASAGYSVSLNSIKVIDKAGNYQMLYDVTLYSGFYTTTNWIYSGQWRSVVHIGPGQPLGIDYSNGAYPGTSRTSTGSTTVRVVLNPGESFTVWGMAAHSGGYFAAVLLTNKDQDTPYTAASSNAEKTNAAATNAVASGAAANAAAASGAATASGAASSAVNAGTSSAAGSAGAATSAAGTVASNSADLAGVQASLGTLASIQSKAIEASNANAAAANTAAVQQIEAVKSIGAGLGNQLQSSLSASQGLTTAVNSWGNAIVAGQNSTTSAIKALGSGSGGTDVTGIESRLDTLSGKFSPSGGYSAPQGLSDITPPDVAPPKFTQELSPENKITGFFSFLDSVNAPTITIPTGVDYTIDLPFPVLNKTIRIDNSHLAPAISLVRDFEKFCIAIIFFFVTLKRIKGFSADAT